MMTPYLQLIALLEMSLTCAVVLIILSQKLSSKEIPFVIRLLAAVLLVNLFFWPLGMSLELPLSAYVRGVTGELSILTMLLLWSSILPAAKKTPLGFKVPVALIAIVFYPLALGLGMLDPYAWGYGSTGLLIATIFFAIWCGLTGWTKGVWILSFAIIAWATHWHESTNLWDYLLDPFLAIWALLAIPNAIYQKRRERAHSGHLFRAG
ncbi:hypothetical protein [Polynucleobacter hallstattensis]|jgi:hypothetical protein|uniref:hypothetical protein n=1 Tax=Polynucleobacter hallstattensis TaxID=1855586 RepID=UPI0021077B13|nr:hypothetical protein [Polynucleobacter hallstattensis]MBU3560264.1 hypothetical protein [Polynucleobacter hallstattensis]